MRTNQLKWAPFACAFPLEPSDKETHSFKSVECSQNASLNGGHPDNHTGRNRLASFNQDTNGNLRGVSFVEFADGHVQQEKYNDPDIGNWRGMQVNNCARLIIDITPNDG